MQPVRSSVPFGSRLPYLLGLIGLAIVFWLFRPWLESFSAWAGSTVSRVGNWTADQLGPPENVSQLKRERDTLRAQLVSVSQELSATRLELETSQTLDILNAFLAEQSLRTITASVIAYSPDPGIESIVIQRGTDHGISDGLAVMTDRGIVVGKVIRTDSTTAVVRLLSDSQSRLLGKVQNQSQSRGLVVGQRGLSLTMEFLPHQDAIEPGQTVVTSGLEPKIPPDLLMATVERVNRKSGELFQTAQLQSPVDYLRLRVVAVVLGR